MFSRGGQSAKRSRTPQVPNAERLGLEVPNQTEKGLGRRFNSTIKRKQVKWKNKMKSATADRDDM